MVLASCGGGTAAVTSAPIAETTTPPPAVASTTTPPSVAITLQGCETPPVTFSPLCEIYELLETWYVDSPIDPDRLAALAVEGLEAFEPETTEDPPRSLICAVPHGAFEALCESMAEEMSFTGLPAGEAVEAAMAHMIDVGLDPFTYYLPPDQTGALRLNGIVGGIGAVLDARDAAGSKCTQVTAVCRLEVVVVLEDNPARAAGLETGDIVTEVDGRPVEGLGFTAAVALIAGDETGVVELAVERGGSATVLEVDRAPLNVPTVEVSLTRDDVGYLRIPDFELDIPPLVSEALAEVVDEGASTIVVDLRDNPGGYVDAYLEIADEFVDGGVVMVTESTYEHFEYTAEPGGAATTQRLIVLVNRGTASAGEVLAASLRESRGATIVGTATFGKDAVQIPFTLRNGGELYVAVARWSTPNGDSAGNGGLTPDREVEWPDGAPVDEIVEIALEASQ